MRQFLLPLLAFLSSYSLASPFTYDDLVKLIQDNHLSTLEEVLPLLPWSFRSRYTLVHKSRSLQKAAYQNPRAIIYGEDARLTCTFNGSEKQLGFDLLECFQYLEKERAFDFRQIQFPTSRNRLKKVLFSKRNLSADGSITCTLCHGNDPRPNWDGYKTWPGAYGAVEDNLDEDYPAYMKFVEARDNHPRYRWLIQDSDLPETPFHQGVRPNMKLSDAVNRMNAQRATRILEGKVTKVDRLAFAVGALTCALSPEQKNKISQAGLSLPDLDPLRIFRLLKMSYFEWSTQIFDDKPTFNYPPYEHQSGFGFLALDVGLAVAKKLAMEGNTLLAEGLNKIDESYSVNHDKDLAFFKN